MLFVFFFFSFLFILFVLFLRYHPGNPPNSDPPSWSDPSHVSDGSGEIPLLPPVAGLWPLSMEKSTLPHAAKKGQQGIQQKEEDSWRTGSCITGERGGSYCEINGTIGPDDKLIDNAVTSLHMMANWSRATGHPFFLGTGIHKVRVGGCFGCVLYR